jgi:hypothetical protein
VNDSNTGIKLLAAIVGFWIIMRAVNKDKQQKTLANYLGAKTVTDTAATAAVTPGSAGSTALAAMSPQQASVHQLLPTLQQLAAQHGWSGPQIADWEQVINIESGGSLTATNRSSGAYGIAQFIQGPSEYAQYGGSANTVQGQLTAMANYIAQRYGTPAGALAHEHSAGWY